MNAHAPSRREFLRAIGAAAAMTAAAPSRLPAAPQPSPREPNIVLIMADDVGYECFGSYGSAAYQTPHLDALARGGVQFAHCYSQPLCTPSRVQIMTGRYNHRNYTAFGVLDPKEKTFGHLLRDAGYATCVAGKWQLYGSTSQRSLRGTGSTPERAGFNEYCLWQIADVGSRFHDPLIHWNSPEPKTFEGKYGPDLFCDYIEGFIERNRARPFFIYYPMALVHSPFVPTPDSAKENESLSEDEKTAANFTDMVAYMDKIVGRIVAKLDALGLRENTLLLFTGDNGTHPKITSKLGEQSIRGGKGATTDAGTRVPLIANHPAAVPPGRVCDDLVDFTDFFPTLAEAAGAEIPSEAPPDGRSFLPQLRGEKGNPREAIFCHYDPRWGKRKMLRFARDKRWKLYGDGRMFDVPADPLEKTPLDPIKDDAATNAARRRLHSVLDDMAVSKPERNDQPKKKENA